MRGIELAREGVALLVRSVWLEGAQRYRSLFAKHSPAIVAQFVERVPMTKGRWDPDASTATAYSWFVWSKLAPVAGETRLVLIPPWQRVALTKPEDRARFAAWSTGDDLPLFGAIAGHRRRPRQSPAERRSASGPSINTLACSVLLQRARLLHVGLVDSLKAVFSHMNPPPPKNPPCHPPTLPMILFLPCMASTHLPGW